MNRYLIIICMIIIWSSCQNRERTYLMNTVKEWKGREIKFPVKSVFTKYVCDTVKNNIDLDFKLMIYVDSVGCTSCKLQLHKWKSFLNELDSITNDKISFLFYVCPKDKREFEHILKRDKFDHPICVDVYDSLNIINNFPSDPRFQVFLLNKINKVIAVGNPVLNPKIKDLYFNILSGKSNTKMDQNSQTQINISEQMINLGSFSWKESQEKKVLLKNTGNSPLVIYDILTSCGCIAVEYDKKPVLFKDSVCVKIIYHAEHPEHFDKTIMIYCNAEGAPFKLRINGDAK